MEGVGGRQGLSSATAHPTFKNKAVALNPKPFNPKIAHLIKNTSTSWASPVCSQLIFFVCSPAQHQAAAAVAAQESVSLCSPAQHQAAAAVAAQHQAAAAVHRGGPGSGSLCTRK